MQSAITRFLPFYYGWVIVGISLLGLTLAWSVRVTFTLFYVAMVEDLGWSYASGTLGYSFSWLALIIFSPLSGYLFDRLGPRATMPLGSGLLVAGLALSSTVTDLWSYILYFSLPVALGEALLLMSSEAIIPRWFIKKRGLAQSIVALGYALGPIALFPLLQYLISSIGWQDTFLVLAGIIASLIPVALLFSQKDPRDVGQYPDGDLKATESSDSVPNTTPSRQMPGMALSEAVRTVSFWSLIIMFFFGVLSYNILLVHQMAHATNVGFEKGLSASIFGMGGFFLFAGILTGGILSDRIGREWAFTIGSGTAILGLAFFASLQEPGELWKMVVFAVATGVGFGFRLPLLTLIPADIFSGPNFGRIFGATQAGSAIGGFVGPYVAGYIFDLLNSYTLAFSIAALSLAVSGSLVWIAAPRRYRRLRAQTVVLTH